MVWAASSWTTSSDSLADAPRATICASPASAAVELLTSRCQLLGSLVQVHAQHGWPRQLVVWVPKGQEGPMDGLNPPGDLRMPLVASQHRQQVVGATQKTATALAKCSRRQSPTQVRRRIAPAVAETLAQAAW